MKPCWKQVKSEFNLYLLWWSKWDNIYDDINNIYMHIALQIENTSESDPCSYMKQLKQLQRKICMVYSSLS